MHYRAWALCLLFWCLTSERNHRHKELPAQYVFLLICWKEVVRIPCVKKGTLHKNWDGFQKGQLWIRISYQFQIQANHLVSLTANVVWKLGVDISSSLKRFSSLRRTLAMIQPPSVALKHRFQPQWCNVLQEDTTSSKWGDVVAGTLADCWPQSARKAALTCARKQKGDSITLVDPDHDPEEVHSGRVCQAMFQDTEEDLRVGCDSCIRWYHAVLCQLLI